MSKSYVYTSFIVVSLINIFLLKVFYKKLGFSKYKYSFLIFIVATTPVYLDLALYEFKIDQFLLMFSLLSFIIYVDIKNSGNLIRYLLFGIFSGLAILTKISVLPFYLILTGLHVFSLFKHRLYKELLVSFISPLIISLLLLFWIVNFGLAIPWTNINIYPKDKNPTVVFEKIDSVYGECLREQKTVDFSHIINDRSIWDFLSQPINYFYNINSGFIRVRLRDPGPYLYISIIIFIPLIIKRREKYDNFLFLATFFYTIYYFISIRTVYWYLFFLFPIYVVPLYEYFFDGNQERYLRFIFLILGASTFLMFLLRNPINNPKKSKFLLGNEYISTMLSNTEGLILDSSPFPQQVFLTFLNDYDKRVVRDSLYFGYSKRSNEGMYAELKENNIRYLILLDRLDERIVFFGCPERHQSRLKDFVNDYGDLYFADIPNDTWVYELK
ncbi:hypothetical protein K0B04_01215 [Patescibacteria group bacterium]|nr:hypothetical protein [Patescibacteria group bacterium]